MWHWTLTGLLVLVAGLTVTSFAEAGAHADTKLGTCRSADLSASYRTTDAAMSHVFGKLRLTNVGEAPCLLQGYGGLSYVGGGDGTQIGAAADRTPSRHVRSMVLQPGQSAVSRVSETSVAAYSTKECRPRAVDGFRVYPPDETHALFVAHVTTGCANPAVHVLSHTAYRGTRG